jgi:hypothetical protein
MARRRPQRTHQHISMSNSSEQADRLLARKDAWSAFVIWIALEGLSLVVLPSSPLISGNHKFSTWLFLSIPLGAIGACLIGVSSWLLKRVQEQVDRAHPNKRAMLISSQAVGWLGLVGIGFPSLMVGLTLWSYVVKGT